MGMVSRRSTPSTAPLATSHSRDPALSAAGIRRRSGIIRTATDGSVSTESQTVWVTRRSPLKAQRRPSARANSQACAHDVVSQLVQSPVSLHRKKEKHSHSQHCPCALLWPVVIPATLFLKRSEVKGLDKKTIIPHLASRIYGCRFENN